MRGEGIGQNVLGHRFDVDRQDTTFIGGVVLAVPCRVPQNIEDFYYRYIIRGQGGGWPRTVGHDHRNLNQPAGE